MSQVNAYELSQVNTNINNSKNSIKKDLIDNLHNPSLEQNFAIALDNLVDNSNSDDFIAQLRTLSRTQTDGGGQYRQLVSQGEMLIESLRLRNRLLHNPIIINSLRNI